LSGLDPGPQEEIMRAIRKAVGVALAVLVAAAGGVWAGTVEELEKAVLANPAGDQPVWALAKAYREGNDARRAVEFFTRFHEANKPNSQSLVWQGSFKASLATTETDMEKRMNLVQAGLADMDRAVRLFGEDVKVRAVRGITLSRFPDFMQMSGKAIDDLEAALKKPETLSPTLQATVRQGLAQAYRQAGRTAEADAVLKSAGGQ
jgi:tetratricopeptide (TPR) repeat protein